MPNYNIEHQGKVYGVKAETPEAAKQGFGDYLFVQDQGMFSNLGRSFASGATFATNDEAEALIRSTFGDADQETILRRIRLAQKQFAKDNPLASFGAEVLGAAATLAVGGGAIGLTAKGAGTVGKIAKGAQTFAKAKPIATGASVGAVSSGLYGAGAGETPEERLIGGAASTVLGGAAGAAFPAVGSKVAKVFGRGDAPKFNVNTLAVELDIDKPTAKAMSKTLTPERYASMLEELQSLPAGSTMADTVEGAKILDSLSSRGYGQQAVKVLKDRSNATLGQMMDTFDSILPGAKLGVKTAQRDIRTETAQAREAAYKKAYASKIGLFSAEGQALFKMQGRLNSQEISAAKKIARAEGELKDFYRSYEVPAPTKEDPFATATVKMPTVRGWDYITRALNDVAEGADGRGAMGGYTQRGLAAKSLSQDVRSALRAASDDYGKALDVAADPIVRSQGVKLGASILNDRVNEEDVAEWVAGRTDKEIEAVREGLAIELRDTISRVKKALASTDMDEARKAAALFKKVSSEKSMAKLEKIMDKSSFAKLKKTIDISERNLSGTARLAQNSKTAQRIQEAGALEAAATPADLLSWITNPVRTVGQAAAALARLIKKKSDTLRDTRKDKTLNAIAELLARAAKDDGKARIVLQEFKSSVKAGSVSGDLAKQVAEVATTFAVQDDLLRATSSLARNIPRAAVATQAPNAVGLLGNINE